MTLAETLAAIPEAYANLPGFLLPGSQPPDPEKRTAATVVSHRSILRLEVVALLDEREKADAPPTRLFHPKFGGGAEHDRIAGQRRQGILPTLSACVRDVDSAMWDEGDEHQNPPTQRTVAGECDWLTSQLDWIEAQPWVTEFEDDLGQMLTDMQRASGTLPERKRPLVCLQIGCNWQVEEMDGGAWFRCKGCGKQWTRVELHRMAERMKPKTLKACAKQLNLSVRTLRTVMAEGGFRPVARDGKTDLFDVSDVAEATVHIRYRTKRTA